MSVQDSKSRWTSVIRSESPFFELNLGELWRYRDLIVLLVRRDLVAMYKQTVLGPAWYFLQPLLVSLVFAVVFGVLVRVPTNGVPFVLFFMSGIVLWTYFVGCLTRTSDTFSGNAYLFSKVYFPRLTMPISVLIANTITFVVQLAVFMSLVLFYVLQGWPIRPSRWIFVVVPLLIVQTGLLGVGVGLAVASLSTRYKDFVFGLSFGTQLWMFLSPIVYPMSQIPERWLWAYGLNPMASIVESFRYAFLGSGTIRLSCILTSVGETVLTLVAAIMLFRRAEKTFIDTV